MNRVFNALIGCALIAGVTIAAIHFNDVRILWFYLLLILFTWRRTKMTEQLNKYLIEHLDELLGDLLPAHCEVSTEALAQQLLEKGVVALPVKVGDYVWRISDARRRFSPRIYKGCVERISFIGGRLEGIKVYIRPVDNYFDDEGHSELSSSTHNLENLGKSYFLSEADAEKYLSGGGE